MYQSFNLPKNDKIDRGCTTRVEKPVMNLVIYGYTFQVKISKD